MLSSGREHCCLRRCGQFEDIPNEHVEMAVENSRQNADSAKSLCYNLEGEKCTEPGIVPFQGTFREIFIPKDLLGWKTKLFLFSTLPVGKMFPK